MAKIMKLIAVLAALLTICGIIFQINLAVVITFGTIAYHFIMRLLTGFVIDRVLNNHVNYRARWFRVSEIEQKFYKKINVKKWKGKMGTYDPSVFDNKIHSWDEIAQATCQAELVHEAIIILSFVPIVLSIPFGALGVFVITSVLAAGFDAIFVIMQRFNRPRILKLIKDVEM